MVNCLQLQKHYELYFLWVSYECSLNLHILAVCGSSAINLDYQAFVEYHQLKLERLYCRRSLLSTSNSCNKVKAPKYILVTPNCNKVVIVFIILLLCILGRGEMRSLKNEHLRLDILFYNFSTTN